MKTLLLILACLCAPGSVVVRHALDPATGSAVSLAVHAANPQVVAAVRMTTRAVRAAGTPSAVPRSPQIIFAGGDGLQVSRVDAVAYPAQMVDVESLGYWPDILGVCNAVGQLNPAIEAALPISLWHRVGRPQPAPRPNQRVWFVSDAELRGEPRVSARSHSEFSCSGEEGRRRTTTSNSDPLRVALLYNNGQR